MANLHLFCANCGAQYTTSPPPAGTHYHCARCGSLDLHPMVLQENREHDPLLAFVAGAALGAAFGGLVGALIGGTAGAAIGTKRRRQGNALPQKRVAR